MTEFLTGEQARIAISAGVLLTVALLAYAGLVTRRRQRITDALAPYTVEPLQRRADGGRHLTLAETPLAQRGVELTARVLRPSRVLPWIERSLEQANVPIRPAEALFFYATGVTVVTVLAGLGSRSAGLALVVVAAAGLAPFAALRLAIERRRRAFETQLPNALQTLASALRSGRSLLQGLQGLGHEAAEPMASEVARVLSQVRLGRSVEEALDDMAVRVASEDARLAVSAVRMQREIGGNLAELLVTVAETMVARDRLRGEVKALTAEGRVSALVLGILPIGLGLIMYTIQPSYVSVLFHDPLGQSMLGGAVLLAVAGFYWMKKTIDVDV